MKFDQNGRKMPAHRFPKAKEPPGKKPDAAFPASPPPHGDRIGMDEDIRVHYAEERNPNDG